MTKPQLAEDSAPNRAMDPAIPEDLRGSLAALERAALSARKLAEQTGTDLIMIRSGRLVRVSPSQKIGPG